MKKFLLLIVFVTMGQLSYFAQDCAKTAINDLSSCLSGNGIAFNYTFSGNTMYIYGLGNPPPGQIQSCIAHYNTLTRDCPDAPMVIDNTGSSQNNTYSTPPSGHH